jgi:hypothetical protein
MTIAPTNQRCRYRQIRCATLRFHVVRDDHAVSAKQRLRRINSGNGHWYKLDGDYAPGVTTVLGELDKPWMKPWVSGLLADYTAERRDWLVQAEPDEIRAVLRAVPNNVRNAALMRGTDLHNAAERLVATGTIDMEPGEQADMVQAVADALEALAFQPLGIEVPVAATGRFKWCGTGDLLGYSPPLVRWLQQFDPTLSEDDLGIVDYKTNKKAIYVESGVQVVAYANADICQIDGVEQPMPPVRWAALIRVEPHGVEIVCVRPSRMADAYRFFTAACVIWHGINKKRGWMHDRDGLLLDPMTPDELAEP